MIAQITTTKLKEYRVITGIKQRDVTNRSKKVKPVFEIVLWNL
jgi:hypothetical protein